MILCVCLYVCGCGCVFTSMPVCLMHVETREQHLLYYSRHRVPGYFVLFIGFCLIVCFVYSFVCFFYHSGIGCSVVFLFVVMRQGLAMQSLLEFNIQTWLDSR